MKIGYSNLTKVLALLLTSGFETFPHATHSVILNVFTLNRLNISYQSNRFSSRQRKKSWQSCCPILFTLLCSSPYISGRLQRSNNIFEGGRFPLINLCLSVVIMTFFMSVGSSTTEVSLPCSQMS